MKIFAIVVTYNGMRWYDQCLGNLRESRYPVETVVIDNASSDNTVEYIKEHFPDVFLIESKENLGFAKANNIGIRYAIDHEADYVFLLNQDAWVEKDTVEKLVQTFEDNEKVGIASPIHLNGSYTALDHGFANYMGGDFTSDAFMRIIKPYYPIPFINAAAWLVSRQCIENVGGFDTLLFKHYGEDDNYCQRVLYHGFHIVVNSGCTICHDREDRKITDNKKDLVSGQTLFLADRIRFGNINVSFDFNTIKLDLQKKIWRKILIGNFKSVKHIKDRIVFYEMIKSSREINKNKGLNWL